MQYVSSKLSHPLSIKKKTDTFDKTFLSIIVKVSVC